jgi:ATP-dependent DNA ligase
MPPVSATSPAQWPSFPARTLILDGELCAFDVNLVYLLDASPEERATPPLLMAFDCLYQCGRTR